jgi:general secretion pathway protein A
MYESHFGLSQKPFNATPDPRFLYTNRGYQEAYATLLYGIQERKGFIALIGEVGTGKTTLLRRLMENMNPATKVVFAYNTTLSFDELVEFICTELGIPVGDLARVARLQALNKFLVAEAAKGSTLVLLLDEAQNLSAEALENLRLISNLETATAKLLQIVLVGQPELDVKLADPALRQVAQRIAVRYRLEPLDDSEVEPYIDYRLRVVGRARRDLFTDKAIRALVPYVNGIPRLINMVCDNALVLAYATERTRVSHEMIEDVVADLRLRRRGEPVARPAGEPEVERAPRLRAVTAAGAGPGCGGRRWAIAGFAVGIVLALAGVFAGSPALRLGLTERVVAMANRTDGTPSGAGSLPAMPGDSSTPAATAPAVRAEPAPERPSLPPPSPVAPTGTPNGASGEARPAPAAEPDPAASASASVTEPAAPTRVAPKMTNKLAGRTLTVPTGGTISQLVFDHYGRFSTLALDLVHELNPDLDDVDVVASGQSLWLPPLTLDALLRRHRDGSYRLIVGSYQNQASANQLAQSIREHGYTATVRTRDVASDQALHRVEITALKTRAAATRAWETANRQGWFDAGGSSDRPPASRTRRLSSRR